MTWHWLHSLVDEHTSGVGLLSMRYLSSLNICSLVARRLVFTGYAASKTKVPAAVPFRS